MRWECSFISFPENNNIIYWSLTVCQHWAKCFTGINSFNLNQFQVAHQLSKKNPPLPTSSLFSPLIGKSILMYTKSSYTFRSASCLSFSIDQYGSEYTTLFIWITKIFSENKSERWEFTWTSFEICTGIGS